MSIDVNEAIIAIREMRPIIDPEEDYLTIVAAEEKIAAAESRRKKELEEGHGNMKVLAKLLESARLSSRRPGSVPSEQAHGKMLNELDKLKLDLMKSISDLESLVVSQETELATLRDEAHRLEEYDPALEHKKELDGSALRLRMYEKLGFEPVFDKTGALIKVLVRGVQSGDIHVIAIDGQKSDSEQSHVLWQLASS